MYRIIFIDDEAITLNLLQNAIYWEKYNIEICGMASDGEEGIELVRQVKPDIIITDIRMPEMNGIALSVAIRQSNRNIKIILLSAYAEFQYAQTAIQYQISDYLLKPLDEDKLEETIARIVQEIEQEKSISKSLSNYRFENAEKQLQQYLIHIQDHHFPISQQKVPAEVLEYFANCDHLLDVISAEPTQDVKDYSYIETISQFFKNQLGAGIGIAVISPIELVALISGSEFQWEISQIPQALRQQGQPVRIGISPINKPFDLAEAYKRAETALDQAFYSGEAACSYLDSFHFSEHLTIAPSAFEHQIVELVEQGKCDELISMFQTQLSDMFLKQVYPSLIYEFILDVFTWIKIAVAKQYKNNYLSDLYTIERHQLQLCATKEDLLSFVISLLENAGRAVQKYLSENTNYYVVRRAKEYTQEHYTEVDFSLQEVSNSVGLSKNHFSKVFHENTGQKYWDYVTSYRIEKAKDLLRNSNQSNYEICLSIGYENEFYFSKVFKRVVGLSPQQYRKR